MVRKHNQPPSGRDEIRAWVDALIRALDDRIWSSFYQKQAKKAEAEDGAQSAGLRPLSQKEYTTK